MINSAFRKFQQDHVDLPSDESQKAKASRAFLIEQIGSVPSEKGFHMLAAYAPINYGSFARRTKLRPLDDIDLLLPVVGRGTEATVSPNGNYTYWLKIKDPDAPLAVYSDPYSYVNSTKVINAIKSELSKAKHYKKADIKKNGEAVTMELASYNWVFDIVPAVPITDGKGGAAYYLIPDGFGNWKATDPRIDDNRINSIDAAHNGAFRQICRLLKYWNNRSVKPRLPSYYFETVVYNTFLGGQIKSPPQAVRDFFAAAPAILSQSCPDPKGLGPNLDVDIEWTEKQKVITSMSDASKAAQTAIGLGWVHGYEQSAIAKWKTIFGPAFGT